MKDQDHPARHGVVLALLVVLAGCASKAPAPAERSGQAGAQAVPAAAVAGKDQYVVKKGDTLHSIALDHGLQTTIKTELEKLRELNTRINDEEFF